MPIELEEKKGIEMTFYEEHQPTKEKALNSYLQLVDLLSEIHAAGVVCSDLKPEHVRQTVQGKLIQWCSCSWGSSLLWTT